MSILFLLHNIKYAPQHRRKVYVSYVYVGFLQNLATPTTKAYFYNVSLMVANSLQERPK